MNWPDFIYRQKQRLKFHVAKTAVDRRLAELNKHFQRVIELDDRYFLKELDIEIPRGKFDYIFERYDLLISLVNKLKARLSVHDLLTIEFDTLRLAIRTAEEIFMLSEIFVDGVYNYQFKKTGSVVIDIGMNVGFSSLFFASKDNVKKVYSFEPFHETYINGLENIHFNETIAPKIHAFNFGLSSEAKTVRVRFSSVLKGKNSIVYNGINQAGGDFDEIAVQDAQTVLQKIIEENPEADIILKIDTEGSEYEIFHSLFRSALSHNIKGVLIEWHKHGFEALCQHLDLYGFGIIVLKPHDEIGLLYALR